jgi:iron complex transport system permease protein
MAHRFPSVLRNLLLVTLLLGAVLLAAALFGLSAGSSGVSFSRTLAVLTDRLPADSVAGAIFWRIRLPRVALAATVGATLALGGLVFQALLRNPLAEPYILGISGGAAVGAIIGLTAGLAPFPGVALIAFLGSMTTLGLVLFLAAGRASGKDSLLLGGVMMNAFCGALIMFLIALSRNSQTRQILFWLMGDLSLFTYKQLPLLFSVLPCFGVVLLLARPMNLLLTGKENAAAMGVNVGAVTFILLVATSLMVSIAVSLSGLVGFVGLVIPHIFRLLLGSDHRVLIPACLLGGAAYLILCDLLARLLPAGGEMPVGIVTAMIGAPLFIFLLWRARR